MEMGGDRFWRLWLSEKPDGHIIRLAYATNYRGDARDVVHDVMLIAQKRLREFDPRWASFTTWVVWIAKGYLTKLYRQPKTLSIHQEIGEGVTLEDQLVGADSPEIEIVVHETTDSVTKAILDALDGRKAKIVKIIIVMIYEGEKPTTRKIAKRIHCSHTTVAQELHEIRRALLQKMDDLL